MSADVFTDPDSTEESAVVTRTNQTDETAGATPATDDWADVRVTDQEEEWDVDAVVVDGQVQYVDLQVHPDVLAGFVDCLAEDVSDERTGTIPADVAARQGLDLAELDSNE